MILFYEKYKQPIQRLIFSLIFIALVYLFFKYVFSYVAPFVIAALLCIAINPITVFFEKRLKIPRGAAAFFSLLAVVALIGGVGTGVASRISGEAQSLFSVLSLYFNNLSENFDAIQSRYLHIVSFTPPNFHNAVDGVFLSLISQLAQSFGSLVSQTTGSLVVVIPNFVMTLVIAFISAFFIIKDRESITGVLLKHSPLLIKNNLPLIKKGIVEVLTEAVKAQLTLTLFTSVICTTGLIILRNPYALFLGLIIAVIDMIPFLGAGLILLPWAVLSLISAEYALGAALIAIYLAVILSRQIVEHNILQKKIGVHPLAMLISIYLGIKAFGLLGFFIGPAAACIVKVILQVEKKPA